MSITLIILLFTVSLSFYIFREDRLKCRLIFSPFIISREKEIFRFITSGFIHADIQHLVFNMLALYFFGEALESTYLYYFGENGRWFFILLYFGGLFFSNLPSFFKYKNDSTFYSLGASGAIDSVVFSFIFFSPTSTLCFFGLICLPAFVYGLIYFIYTIHMSEKNHFYSRINYTAHLYGAIFGLIFSVLLKPKMLLFYYYKLISFL